MNTLLLRPRGCKMILISSVPSWVRKSTGYAGMSLQDFRKQVGYNPVISRMHIPSGILRSAICYNSGYLGTFWEKMSKENFFLLMFALSFAVGLAFFALLKPLEKAIGHGKRTAAG